MIFALGFLAATLIALLIIPAINARADRLARRRAEALFPLSISELTAEKDHLRADFAVQQVRLERKADEALAVKQQTLEEMGRRAVRVEALERDLSDRDAAIARIEADLAEIRAQFAASGEELAATRAELSSAREAFAEVDAAHRRTLDDLAAAPGELDRTAGPQVEAAQVEARPPTDRPAPRESALVDFESRHMGLLNDLDAKRITISDLETRLATQSGRAADFERALNGHRAELKDERERLATLGRDLEAERERTRTLEKRIADLEGGANAPNPELASLRAEHLAAEEALRAARAEIEALRRAAPALPEDVRADNDALRKLVASVADQIVASSEGPASATSRRRRKVST